MKRFRIRFGVLSSCLLLLWLWLGTAVGAGAQNSLTYLRYKVNINLHEDGTFMVQEIQEILFAGEFTQGFADIPLTYTGEITAVSVAGGPGLDHLESYTEGEGGPGTFRLARENETLFVDWEYPPTRAGDRMTFLLEYTVHGGLWVYPDGHRLEWRAVAADRSGLDVPTSRVTVNLPFTVDAAKLDFTAFAPAYTAELKETEGGQSVVFTATEPLPDGTAFQVLVAFPPGLVTAVPQPWQIAADTAELVYTLDRVDLKLALLPDGRLAVTEQQQMTVQEGILYGGSRQVNLMFSEGISDIKLAEGGQVFRQMEAIDACENCFTVNITPRRDWWVQYSTYSDEIRFDEGAAGQTDIRWQVPPLVAGERTTFTLQYVADGVVRPNEDGQMLNWTLIPEYDVPVTAAQARLTLPGNLGLEDVQIEGGTARRTDDGTILVTPETADFINTPWTINLTLPPNATSATKPSWQEDIEQALVTAEAARVRQARIDLAWLIGQTATAVLVILGLLLGWYTWGSRKTRELLGGYRTTPPSDLPPGLVAYLDEQKPTPRSLLAAIIHLGQLGLIRLNLDEAISLERLREPLPADKTTITTPDGAEVRLPSHSRRLFNALAPALPPGKPIPLPDLLPQLQTALPDVYAAMGAEMVNYFFNKQDQSWWQRHTRLLQYLAAAVLFVILLLIFTRGGAQLPYVYYYLVLPYLPRPLLTVGFFALPFVVIFIANALIGRRTRRKLTELGQKECKRWQGFKLYLTKIQQLGGWEEAQAVLDRYFAYGVALGVEERLLAQARPLGTTAPPWLDEQQENNFSGSTQPAAHGRFSRLRQQIRRGAWLPRPPKTTQTSRPTLSGSGLEQISDRLAGALERSSDHLTGLLNTAVGGSQSDPVTVVINAAGQSVTMKWQPGTRADKIIDDIMSKSESIQPPRPSGSGRGSFWGRSSRRSFSRSSSRASSRSSSSRRSGGGGRRGFE